jgi:hypothetical protein
MSQSKNNYYELEELKKHWKEIHNARLKQEIKELQLEIVVLKSKLLDKTIENNI